MTSLIDDRTTTSATARGLLASEAEHVAHNYHPLEVVVVARRRARC